MNKRIFTALCVFVAAHTAFAQQMYVVDEYGVLDTISTSDVDYTTFTSEKDWFVIKNNDIENIGENMFSASCSVSLSDSFKFKRVVNEIEVGVCYSQDTETPTINDHSISIGIGLNDHTFTVSPVRAGTTFYYRVYVKLLNDVFYGDVAKVTTFGTAPADNSQVINGHNFIDLGLPSGLLWAETNVKAKTAADAGTYFAWGEIKSKFDYSWDTYKYFEYGDMTKYNSSDGRTVLYQRDDAAYVYWKKSCRMPTQTEFEELNDSDNCTWVWTSKTASDGSIINGYEVMSNKNGNSIFLPASGRHEGDSLISYGLGGCYWSSTLCDSDIRNAYGLFFDYGVHGVSWGWENRYCGYTIRPVVEP